LIVDDGIRRGNRPSQFVYFPCDNLLRRQEIVNVVNAAKQLCQPQPDRPLTLFLDEITSVKEWHKTVKWLADANMLVNVALALTGSSAYDIRRGYERMPGRREGGSDICLLPMGFRTFCRILAGIQAPDLSLWEMVGLRAAFEDWWRDLTSAQTTIIRCLKLFLQHGGFPQVVAELKRNAEPRVETRDLFLSIIASAIEKQRRSTATLRMVLSGIYTTLTTPVSLNRLASVQNIPSAATVKDYLELLHSSFICFPVAPLDLSKGTAFPRKNRKYYFVDPAFAGAVGSALGLRPLDVAQQAEQSVGVNVIRHFARDWARWGQVDALFYWRSSSNREVDFVVKREGRYFGIEVKYQTQVSGWDEMSISRGIGQGMLVTRDHFEYGPVHRIPLWAFLLLSI